MKTRTGNPVGVEKSTESGINGKQKDSAQKETRSGSATMRISVEKQHNRPLLAPGAQTENDGKSSLKGKTLRGRSPSGKRSRRPCRNNTRGNCTTPSCDYGYPPECQDYKTHSGCKFGELCVLTHKEVDSLPNKKQKKTVGEGAVVSLKNSKQ